MTEKGVKTGYSAAELAALHVPRYPRSDRGMRDVATREAWPFVETAAKGGKRGIRRDYLFSSLPQEIKDAIVVKERPALLITQPRGSNFDRWYDAYMGHLLDAKREEIERVISEIERVIL